MRHPSHRLARIGLVVVIAAGTLTVSSGPGYAAADVTISGRVADASGHGWPLYARIDVSGVGTFFTNPGTGRYSFMAAASATYDVRVTPVLPGYDPLRQDVVVGTGDKTANFDVKVSEQCVAPGYASQLGEPILNESFDGTSAPPGWSVVNRTTGGGWTFTDVRNRGNMTGGTGGFAIVDSDALGGTATQDTDLITPPLDLSGLNAPFLRFGSDFRAVGLNDVASVEYSVDGGATWGVLWRQTTSRRGPLLEEISLLPAAGSANALVRFHYIGSFDWWWEVDDVQIVNRSCEPVPGGLVVGVTTDRNTGAGLNGVRVFNANNPRESAVSIPTPDDTALPDGIYWLFTAAGEASFTATKQPYADLTRATTVTADAVRRLDFALRAGRLSVTPTAVGTFQPYGSTRTTGLTFTNTGTAPVAVNLLEQTGGFEILLNLLGRTGATARTVPVVGGVSKAMHEPVKAEPPASALAASPAIDDAWQPIADYPTSVLDNSAATIDGIVYSVGGGATTGVERLAFAYDPATNSWRALPTMPTGRTKPQAVAVGTKLYVFGGWGESGDPVASVDVFDTVAGSWSTLAATNPKPRAAAGAGLAGGRIYLIGGCVDDACTDSADVVRFDPATGQFSSAIAGYPHAASWISCGGITGRVYCAGGVGEQEFSDAYRYDPATNAWARVADMPQQFWASAHNASNDLLIISGGVTDDSTAITNRTVAYDPTTDTWLDLPDAQFIRYRGAGSCGGYKIGGSSGGFSGAPQSERLGGLNDCALDAVNVPWLGLSPATFSVAAGASRVVTVSLTATAAAGISQPGRYTAEIKVGVKTPYSMSTIPVEMNVSAPEDAGKVQGVVRAQGCTGGPVAIPATLRFNPVTGTGTGATLVADLAGRYAIWLTEGEYDVIIAKDGWVPELQRITVTAGFINTFEPVLEPVGSC